MEKANFSFQNFFFLGIHLFEKLFLITLLFEVSISFIKATLTKSSSSTENPISLWNFSFIQAL